MGMDNARLQAAKEAFARLYGTAPAVIAQAPGRAEILGCHTDYNHGFALAAGISRNTLCLVSKRADNTIAVCSTAFPKQRAVKFIVKNISRDEEATWTNYVRAVVKELVHAGFVLGGTDILIDSNVPKSGGVSSSAALELAVAFALLALYKEPIDRARVAFLCKLAENGDIVRSPCGFLDQGASAFAEKDALVFLDFLPKGDSPVSDMRRVACEFPSPAAFVISIDPALERRLGETGYVARRKMCEDSLPFWSGVLGKNVQSLRDVALADFRDHREALEKKNPVMRKRVEHVIRENQRVLDAVVALENKDIETFGKLLTESGRSSLELYELDENTPQLTLLVQKGRELPGVFGMRNMGGGFSAIGLAFVRKAAVASFKQTLSRAYDREFHRSLDFMEFTPSEGAGILYG